MMIIMNLISITAYITPEQKCYLDNRKKGTPSVSSLIRNFLSSLMENENNESNTNGD